MRPYLSVDLETTGLDMKSAILEIAFVLDDGKSPVDQLEKHSYVIQHNSFTHAEPYALNMNAALIKQIAEKKDTVSLEFALKQLEIALTDLSYKCQKYDEETKAWRIDRKVCIAGKNVASFDIPLLRANGFTSSLISHRTIDTGSMYFKDFGGVIPSQGEINKLIGREEVSHRALDDAMDVVCAIRAKLLSA